MENSEGNGNTRPPDLPFKKPICKKKKEKRKKETYMQVTKQQLELDMEQQTGSKQEKEYIKAVYCHPAYLISMQSTS